MTSNLYILAHATEPRFKIGKANCINSRIEVIGYTGLIDLEKSLYVNTPSPRDALKLEGHMHYLFEDSRLERLAEDGGSEWFDIECFDAVRDAVDAAAKMKGFILSKGVPKPAVKVKAVSLAKKKDPRDSFAGTEKHKPSFTTRDRPLSLHGARELKEYLSRDNSGRVYYFGKDGSLWLYTEGESLSVAGEFSARCFIFGNRSTGITIIPAGWRLSGGSLTKFSAPSQGRRSMERLHRRIFKWIVSTLDSHGADDITEQRNEALAKQAA